jgi:hypothetical protein
VLTTCNAGVHFLTSFPHVAGGVGTGHTHFDQSSMFANGGWVILRRAMSTEQREKVIVFIVVLSGVKHATNALSSTKEVPKKYQRSTKVVPMQYQSSTKAIVPTCTTMQDSASHTQVPQCCSAPKASIKASIHSGVLLPAGRSRPIRWRRAGQWGRGCRNGSFLNDQTVGTGTGTVRGTRCKRWGCLGHQTHALYMFAM